jgi:hypothetical protein
MPQEDVGIIANDDSPANEQTPLLNGSSSLLIPRNFTDPTTLTTPPSLKLILPALMLCAFLAAFDVTVVAAIYPIMFFPPPQHSLMIVAPTSKVQTEYPGSQ